jgi:hypothetical protein
MWRPSRKNYLTSGGHRRPTARCVGGGGFSALHWKRLWLFCVDEKPSIQALERKTGYIKTDSGKVIRAYKSTYKRHGTLNLFAALEVSTGKIQGKVTQEISEQIFKPLWMKLPMNTLQTKSYTSC